MQTAAPTTTDVLPELLTTRQVATLTGRHHAIVQKVVDTLGVGTRLGDRRAIRPHELPAIREELAKHRTYRTRKQKAAAT